MKHSLVKELSVYKLKSMISLFERKNTTFTLTYTVTNITTSCIFGHFTVTILKLPAENCRTTRRLVFALTPGVLAQMFPIPSSEDINRKKVDELSHLVFAVLSSSRPRMKS